MQEYPWPDKFSEGVIPDALKAVKGSELHKQVDRFLCLVAHIQTTVIVQWASLRSVAKDKQMAWIKTNFIFGLVN